MKVKIARFVVASIAKTYEFVILLYVKLELPWVKAKFYTAWEYYQKDEAYRQRLTILGFKEAVRMFLDSQPSQNYCFKKQIEKYPQLEWQVLFLPWSIQKPDIFDIAAASGITSYGAR